MSFFLEMSIDRIWQDPKANVLELRPGGYRAGSLPSWVSFQIARDPKFIRWADSVCTVTSPGER